LRRASGVGYPGPIQEDGLDIGTEQNCSSTPMIYVAAAHGGCSAVAETRKVEDGS
jgi:hypothetical protein